MQIGLGSYLAQPVYSVGPVPGTQAAPQVPQLPWYPSNVPATGTANSETKQLTGVGAPAKVEPLYTQGQVQQLVEDAARKAVESYVQRQSENRHTPWGGYQRDQNQSQAFNGCCNYCGETGHFLRECPARSADLKEGMIATNDFGRITLANGSSIPPWVTGDTMRERVVKWWQDNPRAGRQAPPHMPPNAVGTNAAANPAGASISSNYFQFSASGVEPSMAFQSATIEEVGTLPGNVSELEGTGTKADQPALSMSWVQTPSSIWTRSVVHLDDSAD